MILPPVDAAEHRNQIRISSKSTRMDARMSQQDTEGLSGEPETGEKHREPEGQVVGGISLGTFLLLQESTSPVGARTHH